MSCNGCRVLRKGCAESCVLRTCLQWIEGAEAQGHATVFVAKFFGRAGLMSFVSNVPAAQRPALFRSLLYEACGRTINPVGGAVGLLWSGNWHLCEAAVETVLRGGSPLPLPAEPGGCPGGGELYAWPASSSFSSAKRWKPTPDLRERAGSQPCDLDLCLTPRSPAAEDKRQVRRVRRRRPGTPPEEEASVTTSEEVGGDRTAANQPRLLNLFV